MFEILKAILFGIVEGVTEWLPISSTGHLILLNQFVKLSVSDEFYSMFEVVIQLGAILAVIVLFFQRLNPFSPKKSPAQKRATWDLWAKVIVAILPSGVLGVLLDDWMEAHLYHYITVAIALIAYGVAFILVERSHANKKPVIEKVGKIDYKTALLIGCFQCLSLIPGTSRSGSTILGAILLGVSRPAAAEFSFFMAIPTMVGASGLKALKFIKGRHRHDRQRDHDSPCGLHRQLPGEPVHHPQPDGVRPQALLLRLRRVPYHPGRTGAGLFPHQQPGKISI